MQTSETNTRKIRAAHVDLLRGAVMIIMALDHTRDFFHEYAFTMDPLNPGSTSSPLYLTRWITHLCAPVFVFLAGASIWMQHQRTSTFLLSKKILVRGLWIILLDVTVMTAIILLDPDFEFIVLQVLWAIGVSMVVLALFLFLPTRIVLVIGLLIVFGHNALDFYEKGQNEFPVWYSALHRENMIPISNRLTAFLAYPVLPWIGVMFCGFGFGAVFSTMHDRLVRRKILMAAIAMLFLFAALRFINVYGDPLPYTTQTPAWRTALSFFNVTKYPPSLQYLLVTLGLAFAGIAIVANPVSRIGRIIMVFGRVPMFYYLMHFAVLSLLRIVYWLARGRSFSEGVADINGFPFKFIRPAEGVWIGYVYLIWIAVVIALYPVCKRYAAYKQAHPEKKWLSFF